MIQRDKSNRCSIRCIVPSGRLFIGAFLLSAIHGTINPSSSSAAPSGNAYRVTAPRVATERTGRTLSAADEARVLDGGLAVEEARYEEPDDPLAFLEGPARCDEIARGVARRYGKDGARHPVTEVLREEFRHVMDATCRGKKFSSCNFVWCAAAAAAREDRPGSTRGVESGRSIETAKINGAVKAEPERVQVAKAEVTKTEPARLESANSVAFRGSNDAPAVAGPDAELVTAEVEAAPKSAIEKTSQKQAARARLAAGAPSDDVVLLSLDNAQTKLSQMVKEREQRLNKLILAKKTEEQRQGIAWKTFTVPGTDRPARLRFEAPAEEKAGQIGDISDHVAPVRVQAPAASYGVPAMPQGRSLAESNALVQERAMRAKIQREAAREAALERHRVQDMSATNAQNKFFQMFTDAANKLPKRQKAPLGTTTSGGGQ